MGHRRSVAIGMVAAVLLAAIPVAPVAARRGASEPAAQRCTITGTERADTLRGTRGRDVICGLGGADTIRGLAGDDVVIGGPGPDRIAGGPGRDEILGGTGADICAPDTRDTLLDTCPIDQAGPVLGPVDIPATIAAGERLVVRFTLQDAVGVDLAWVRLGGPMGWVPWCDFEGIATRVAGTPQDGTWERTCDLPANAVNGTYTAFIDGVDLFGNPVAGNGGISVDFAIAGGSDDNVAPAISDLVAPADPVRGVPWTMEWRATDPSGTAGAVAWMMRPNGGFADENGVIAVIYSDPYSERVAGTPEDGTWRQTIVFPSDAPAGTWSIWISRRDTLGNREMTEIGTVELRAP